RTVDICSLTVARSAWTTVPELRFDSLRQEWVAYNTERNDRTFLPTGFCPLCPSGPEGDSEIPLDDFEVVVFENRFPAVGHDPRDGDDHAPGAGCEVIVYTPDHTLALARLRMERIPLLVDVWADRYETLGARPDVSYVFIFENKGEEIGVTLHHPHGQIYALPFIPPVANLELAASRRHLEATGQCLHCEQIRRELAGERLLFRKSSTVASVPHAARWPFEFYPPHRRADRLKHLAGVELGAGTFVNDTRPEETASQLRRAIGATDRQSRYRA